MDGARSTAARHDGGPGIKSARAVWPIIGIIAATVVLDYGKEILLPLTMASMLAVVFSPLARRLERFVPPFLAAALVVLTAIVPLGTIGYFVTLQLEAVVVEVSGYSNNIGAKLAGIEKATPQWLMRVEEAVQNVEERMSNAKGGAAQPQQQQHAPVIIQGRGSLAQEIDNFVKPAIPVLVGLADSLIVVVLFFFLLYRREGMRNRFVRLAARARITMSAEAMDAASGTVGHYLFLFAAVNLLFGIEITIVTWIIGLPNPLFWGMLAFVLRFIPYIGATVAGVFPTLVAFAIFPGWSQAVEVIAAFIVLDQVSAQFLEPLLIGSGIGVSPVALLVMAIYWGWLWGVAGLVVAIPITAFLKAAGDHIPELGFFSVLFGAEVEHEEYEEYYRRMLEMDLAGARDLAMRYCGDHGLEDAFNSCIIPAIVMAGEEHAQDHISDELARYIIENARAMISELGLKFSNPKVRYDLHVLGVCPPNEMHDIGLMALLELLRESGMATAFGGPDKSFEEVRELIEENGSEMICLSCTMADGLRGALALVRDIKAVSSDVAIVVGGRAAIIAAVEFIKAGCWQVYASQADACRSINRYAIEHSQARDSSAEAGAYKQSVQAPRR